MLSWPHTRQYEALPWSQMTICLNIAQLCCVNAIIALFPIKLEPPQYIYIYVNIRRSWMWHTFILHSFYSAYLLRQDSILINSIPNTRRIWSSEYSWHPVSVEWPLSSLLQAAGMWSCVLDESSSMCVQSVILLKRLVKFLLMSVVSNIFKNLFKTW